MFAWVDLADPSRAICSRDGKVPMFDRLLFSESSAVFGIAPTATALQAAQ